MRIWSASSILDAVAQPDTTALEHLTAVERDRTNRGWRVGFVVAGVEDARRPLGPIDGRKNRQADLADETRTQEGAVGHAAAVHFETFYGELPIQGLQRDCKIKLLLAGKNIGHTVLPQSVKMSIAHLFRQHGHNWIALDVGPPPCDLTAWIEHNAESSGIAASEP